MRRLLGVWLVLVLVGCAGEPEAVDVRPELVVRATVNRSLVHPDEVIEYTVELDWGPDVNPLVPEFGRGIEGLRIIEQEVEGPDLIDGRQTQVFRYQLSASRPGSFEIPGVEVPYNSSSSDSGAAATEAILVEVRPAEEGALEGDEPPIVLDDQLRDIEGAQTLRDPNVTAWIIGSATLFAAIFGVWIWLSRKQWTAPLPPAAPPPPHRVALRDLESLRSGKLLPRGETQRFAFELSGILRRYLGQRFEFPAVEWTTTEILQGLPTQLRTASRQFDLRQVLDATDMVKYAGKDVGATKLLNLTDVCEGIVEETRPEDEEEDDDARSEIFLLDEAEEDTVDGPLNTHDDDGTVED